MESPLINILHSLEITENNRHILTTLKEKEMQEAPKHAIPPTNYSVLIFFLFFFLPYLNFRTGECEMF